MTISDLQYWNQRNFIGLDLTNVDFSGYRLESADFSGADLTGANLYCADLSGANFAGANLENAVLIGANLSKANLTDTNLFGAKLWGFGFNLFWYVQIVKMCMRLSRAVTRGTTMPNGTLWNR